MADTAGTHPLNPPFRAEHIGSFLRPPALLKARAAHAAGRLTDAELRAAEDDAIRDFVALQERLGFQAVTDGEFRRSTYSENLTTAGMTGVTAEQSGEMEWSYTNAAGHKERAPAAGGDRVASAGRTPAMPRTSPSWPASPSARPRSRCRVPATSISAPAGHASAATSIPISTISGTT